MAERQDVGRRPEVLTQRRDVDPEGGCPGFGAKVKARIGACQVGYGDG